MNEINTNKPHITFKIGDDGDLLVQAQNYPVVKGKCTGMEATENFENGLGKPGQRQFTQEQYQEYQEEQQHEQY